MNCKSQGQVVPSFGWTYPDSTVAGSDSSLHQQLSRPVSTAVLNEGAFVPFDFYLPGNVNFRGCGVYCTHHSMGIRRRVKSITAVLGVMAALLVCVPPTRAQTGDSDGSLPSGPLPANPISGPWPASSPDFAEGLIKLDVVVTDKTGTPVAGLTKQDFTLLDNGQPQKLVSFRAVDGFSAPFDPANPSPRVILVLDGLNLDSVQYEAAHRAAQDFLRQNQGRRQPYATTIYRLTRKGLFASEGALVEFPDSHRGCGSANSKSLTALGKIVLDQRRMPGRKLLVWIGPGWPVALTANCPSGLADSFDWITEFSTRMREARIALYQVSIWSGGDVIANEYLVPPKAARGANPAHLSLPALALRSGGRVLNFGSELAGLLNQAVAEAGACYTLTFDPPHASAVDEYHEIRIETARPDNVARAIDGYYDEPSYYDQPDNSIEQATVEELEHMLAAAHRQQDAAIAQQLERTALTERLSGSRMPALRAVLPGEKSRQALVALADASAFLRVPVTEQAKRPAPDLAGQRAMMSRTLDYLGEAIPHLPDFFAIRTTARYEPPPQKDKHEPNWKTDNGGGPLQFSSSVVETIRYRDGYEVVDPVSAQRKHPNEYEESLDTRGTFGPILYTVIKDAAASALSWSHWEEISGSERAVFQYAVPKENSHYSVSFCCMTDMNGSGVINWVTGYRGELTIDPDTGAILRLAVQADLEPRMPLLRADIMVTYRPVDIGGKSFIVPTHSVAISRKRTVTELTQWGDTLRTFSPFITILNDVTFTNYHKFGSESRMLPGFTPVPDDN